MTVTLEPPFTAFDANDLAGRLEATADEIDQAVADASVLKLDPPARGIELVAVGGMGGSAIAADLTASLYADVLPRPMLVVRDLHWPAWLDSGALAVLSSFSGDTAETLSLYEEAGRRGVPRVAITTGGALAERCQRDGVAVMPIRAKGPPRAAVPVSWVMHTFLLGWLGWIEDPKPAWKEATTRLRQRRPFWGPQVVESKNPVKQTARILSGRLVMIYAGSERLGPLATRLRNQLNENAKLLAHSALAPELNHNEIVGWERPILDSRKTAVVLLRDGEDAPEVTVHLDYVRDYVATQDVPVVEVGEQEGGRLSRMVSTLHWGDCLSFYLAVLNGVDPTPIASIDGFKRRLAAWRRGSG